MTDLMVIGAHPDDCELSAGGLAALCARSGGRVALVSMTNGEAGHQAMAGAALAERRKRQHETAAASIGAEAVVLDNRDGELFPSLELRRQVIRLIRNWRPHVLITHRSCDYHPDHRNTGLTVQDAAYMLTVPNICAPAPAMARNPIILFASDRFTRPYPFQPDLVFDIDPVADVKLGLIDTHESTFYEWEPWLNGRQDEVPSDRAERREWAAREYGDWLWGAADRFRDRLIAKYGERRGADTRHAEAYELCEYGTQPSARETEELFPF
jgi:LmbE family N-acetylglucosaminyl deacetylase